MMKPCPECGAMLAGHLVDAIVDPTRDESCTSRNKKAPNNVLVRRVKDMSPAIENMTSSFRNLAETVLTSRMAEQLKELSEALNPRRS